MRVLAEVPPLVVPGAYTAIALGACLSFAFLWVFDKVWRNSIGFLFEKIGNTGFGGIAGHGSVKPLHFLVDWSHTVENRTRLAMAASEHAIVYGFGALLWAFYDLAFTIAKTAYDFNSAIDNLWAQVTHGTTKIVHETVVKPTTRAVRYADAKLTARVKTLEHEIGALSAKVAHTAAVLPHEVVHLPARVGYTSKQLRRMSGRLSRLEKLTVGLGAVALVGAALRKMKLGCLLGRNGRTVGKRLCSVDPDFLESLFIDGALLLGTISLVEFAKETAAVTKYVESKVVHFLRELGPAVQDYLGPIAGAPKDVEALLKLSFSDYLD